MVHWLVLFDESIYAQEHYRVRVGMYRILYEIHNNVLIVTIVKVAHRREVYHRGLNVGETS
jgi:mRNA interferase RelE/StbE